MPSPSDLNIAAEAKRAAEIALVFDPAERRLLRVCEIYGWKLAHWRSHCRGFQMFFRRGEIPPDVARIARGDLLVFARSLLAGLDETPRGTKKREPLNEENALAAIQEGIPTPEPVAAE